MDAQVLKITGDVNITIPQVCVRNSEKMPTGTNVVVDLGEVGDIDSACVAMMVMMKRRSQGNGNTVSFINLPEKLLRLVDLYDLAEILNIERKN